MTAPERREGRKPEEGAGLLARGGVRSWGIDGKVREDLVGRGTTGRGLPGPASTGDLPAGNGPTGRGPVLRDSLGGRPAVLKILRHGGLLGRLLGWLPGDAAALFLGEGRLRRATHVANAFRERGGNAPRPLGWLSISRGPWRRLVLATEELAATVTLDRPLVTEGGGRRAALLAAAGQALARWHHAGLVHPDLNLGNILVRVQGDGSPVAGDLAVIDLEGARLVRHPGPGPRAAALARLERSALKVLGPGALSEADRWRFLVAYNRERALLEDRSPADARRLLRQLLPSLRWRRRLFVLHGLSV